MAFHARKVREDIQDTKSWIRSMFQRTLSSVHYRLNIRTSRIIAGSRETSRRRGVTATAWKNVQRLAWDVTCVETIAESYMNKIKLMAGSAAEVACTRNHKLYTKIVNSNFIFLGLAFETLGPCCVVTKKFINTLGDLLIRETGDVRSKHFLYQRISLAVQRGNAASVSGTLPNSTSFIEIFNL